MVRLRRLYPLTSLLARERGAPQAGQWLAGAIVASLPMAILQASSAQNDFVLSLWLAAFAWFGLQALRTENDAADQSPLRYSATALALAIATKGTAFIIGGTPLGVGIAGAIRRWPRDRLVRVGLEFGFVISLINGPLWVRNYRLYDAPLGQRSTLAMVRAQRFGARALISNLTRNAALHLGTPWPEANHALETVVRDIHRVIGIDVNDPRLTWTDSAVPDVAFQIPPLNRDEDHAGNLLGLLLI